MGVIDKIKEYLRRDPCKECSFYIKSNNTCQSKKCVMLNGNVTWFDRLCCEPYINEKEEESSD